MATLKEFEGEGWKVSTVSLFPEVGARFRFGEMCEHGPPECSLEERGATPAAALRALRSKLQTMQDATAAAVAWIDQELGQ